ncbi:hypothetical protein [Bacteroides sp. 51]|uniref:hypothetical protein n=1 Tax=Bacteroides sp. 51 TaxID=2302938 RepID=UPI0013D1120D|nr:hypothetical protein [Bacteroides sp. 51]NDV82933.1 hypothetical protein [Bacteroides sp. 51]
MERITNYKEYLAQPIYRLSLHKIVDSVSVYPEDFDIVYKLIKDPQEKVSWRAAWACEKIFEKYPDFLEGKQKELIAIVMNNKHSGTRRILLSILLELPAPEPLPVDFLDFCFNNMLDLNQAIATQALCIKMSYKLCLLEPELLPELKLYLENAEPEYYSPGVKSCIRNVLKRLN